MRDISRKAGKPVDLVHHRRGHRARSQDGRGDHRPADAHGAQQRRPRHRAAGRARGGRQAGARRRCRSAPTTRAATSSSRSTDDGAGLDTERILESARSEGADRGRRATPRAEDIHQLIFEPGFSTAAKVTEVSGRGVGMDVVRRNIEALRGRVDIRTERGQGTTFPVRLPLTLAVLDGLLVGVGSERFVLPTTGGARVAAAAAGSTCTTCRVSRAWCRCASRLLPLVTSATVLGMRRTALDPVAATVVVVEDGGSRVGLVVDELLRQAGSRRSSRSASRSRRARRRRRRHSRRRPDRADSRPARDRRAGARRTRRGRLTAPRTERQRR